MKKTLLALVLLFFGGGALYYGIASPLESRTVTLDEIGLFRSSYRVEVERKKFLGLGRQSLVISSSPSEAGVTIDGKEYGKTPLILEKLSPQKHRITLTKAGYEDLILEVDLKDNWLTRVFAELLLNPLKDLREIKGVDLSAWSGTDSTEFKPQTRMEWAAGPPRLNPDSIRTANWKRLHLYAIDLPGKPGPVRSVFSSLEALAQKKLNLPAIPFAYLIDEEGVVYEGLGIYNFNYEGLLEKATAGEAPVLIINQEGEVLNDRIRTSLAALEKNLQSLSRRGARVVTQLGEIYLETGKQRELNLEFVNVGNRIWRSGEVFLESVTENNRISEFYSPDNWISPTRVSTFTKEGKEFVLPGETATFKLVLLAPFYPGEFVERFSLLDEVVGLKVKVEGERGRVVEVLNTPTGFLNVREGPGIGFALKGTVYPGERYLVLEDAKGWLKLRLRDGSEGWVIERYVKDL